MRHFVFEFVTFVALSVRSNAWVFNKQLDIAQATPRLTPLKGLVDLTILHFNDVHARVEAADRNQAPCRDDAKDECYGGMAKLATVAKEVRGQATAQKSFPLVVDAGDEFMGTLWNTYYKGSAISQLHNMLGVDAFAFGNHEFDFGPKVLANFTDNLETNIVSCNVDFTRDENFKGQVFQRYHVFEREANVKDGSNVKLQKIRVAVVGYTTPATPKLSSPGDLIDFSDEKRTLEKCVADAKKEAHIVILLGHSGYTLDQEFAMEPWAKDVTAIIGGHSHTPLGSMSGAKGPYPTLVKNGNRNIPVLQAFWASKYAGHIAKLTVDLEDGAMKNFEGKPVTLASQPNSTDYVKDDPEIKQTIKNLVGPLNEFRQEQVGTSAKDIDGSRERCRTAECEMGNFLCDAMLWKVNEENPKLLAGYKKLWGSITNGGGLRSSINKGRINVEDVMTVLPFGNQMALLEVTGAQLKIAINQGLQSWSPPESGDLAGAFGQVGGLKYRFNGHLRHLENVVFSDGTPVDNATKYLIATNDYIARGGDYYDEFKKAKMVNAQVAVLADVLMEYIRKHNEVNPVLDGRIVQVDVDYDDKDGAAGYIAPLYALFFVLVVFL